MSDERHAVTVLGNDCEHRWDGTVIATPERYFKLAESDALCPACGGDAGSVMFGGGRRLPGDTRSVRKGNDA